MMEVSGCCTKISFNSSIVAQLIIQEMIITWWELLRKFLMNNGESLGSRYHRILTICLFQCFKWIKSSLTLKKTLLTQSLHKLLLKIWLQLRQQSLNLQTKLLLIFKKRIMKLYGIKIKDLEFQNQKKMMKAVLKKKKMMMKLKQMKKRK